MIGPEAYKTLRNLITPAKIGDLSYTELVASMQLYYSPRPSEIILNLIVSFVVQGSRTVSMYIAELRNLAEIFNLSGDAERQISARN